MIRPSFIREYHSRNRASWEERLRILRLRDKEHLQLNTEFGVERSSSYHSQSDPNYDRRYKGISSKFSLMYEDISLREKEWITSSDITISEFLYLDNFSSYLEIICSNTDLDIFHKYKFIEEKVKIYLNKWKNDFNYMGMQHRVNVEIDLFRDAKNRCVTHFSINPWDISKQREIFLYRKAFTKELQTQLNRMCLA